MPIFSVKGSEEQTKRDISPTLHDFGILVCNRVLVLLTLVMTSSLNGDGITKDFGAQPGKWNLEAQRREVHSDGRF